jgi:hypothetical protein
LFHVLGGIVPIYADNHKFSFVGVVRLNKVR